MTQIVNLNFFSVKYICKKLILMGEAINLNIILSMFKRVVGILKIVYSSVFQN